MTTWTRLIICPTRNGPTSATVAGAGYENVDGLGKRRVDRHLFDVWQIDSQYVIQCATTHHPLAVRNGGNELVEWLRAFGGDGCEVHTAE